MGEPFDTVMASLDNPMAVVTAAAGDERAGCLVGFHAQSGIDPERYCIWLSKANHTYRIGLRSPHLGVHFLTRDDLALAELFGTRTGDEVDKFERCAWRPGPDGVPLLDECPNRFVGRVVERIDFGDHVGMALEPFFAEADEDSAQLGFHRAKRIEPGHEA